ncbi:Crp/Fnr family transcriptional regulator [Dysgonomonas sp. GY617]|uniref:Crp/Fnr family transcriptional regulator n=1 Tax=Dysgonomonas sp. GY617 TaxID=2780420 RepID=UPI001883EF85|nr:Crp/Fnr family transcriptional regulator [Dysgonomonas sp. GY617]MBF0575491.1 Crp/Fnr family transcriptional regulator [Dysgonomonas sp. GY617]
MQDKIKIAEKISLKYKHPLSPQDLESFASILERKELSKGELFLNNSQVSKYIQYVDKGLVRQFYYKNGRDVTEHFTCENNVAVCIESFFRQEPTRLLIEALETTILYCIPYSEIEILAYHKPEISILYRRFLEATLILSQQKADSWRFETVRERYERFMKEYPQAAKRAPIAHIASYLLMTPESLSRVRSGQW